MAAGGGPMDAVLLRWLDDMGVSIGGVSVEEAFSSGYLFAEVLHLFGQCASFPEAFREAREWAGPRGVRYAVPRVDELRANYAALLPELARLGIALDTRGVAALVARAPGAAPRLLYELKARLGALEDGGRGVAGRASVPGGRPLLRLRARAEHPLHAAATAGHADRLLRALVGVQREKTAREVVARFTGAAARAHAAGEAAAAAGAAEARRGRLAAARLAARASFASVRDAAAAREVAGADAWAAAAAARARDVAYVAAWRAGEEARARARTGAARAAAAADVAFGAAEAAALRAAQGVAVAPAKGAREAGRVGAPPPSSALRRDDFFAELNARLGIPGASPGEALFRPNAAAFAEGGAKLSRRRAAEGEAARSRCGRRAAAAATARAALEAALDSALRTGAHIAASLGPTAAESALIALVAAARSGEAAFEARRASVDAEAAARVSNDGQTALDEREAAWDALVAEHDAAVDVVGFWPAPPPLTPHTHARTHAPAL
jgi:hypothetical protein